MSQAAVLEAKILSGENVSPSELAAAQAADAASKRVNELQAERAAILAKADRERRAKEAAQAAVSLFKQIDDVAVQRQAANDRIKQTVKELLDSSHESNELLLKARGVIESAKGIEPSASLGMAANADGFTAYGSKAYTPIADWETDVRNLLQAAIVEAKQS